jgi:hypothetical protein
VSVHDVPRARWAGVLEQFSLTHRGLRARVAAVRPGPELAFRTGWYPLESVAIARTGTRPAAILVNFQGAPAVCVTGPRVLAVGTRDGAERALETERDVSMRDHTPRGQYVDAAFLPRGPCHGP